MIRVLDPQTVGQIAAGEVIERPVSVVKELVENAVDAGARRVAVSVGTGGLDFVEVSDDGAGIAPHDLPLSVLRHATSKLSDAADLESIASLGFRGEGLASIAAVAQLSIVSRQARDEVGARIVAHAETAGKVEPVAAPIGTAVRAENLFANVPVRREYVKSANAEFARISSWLSTFALAYPQIAFSLAHNGQDVWALPPTDEPRQRLGAVFGSSAKLLLDLDASAAAGLSGNLDGFISAPGNERNDRRLQILFVNGRLLRSTLLAGAWTAGYATFAMSGRQPFGVLSLTLPADHIDANVHPTKSDVRLRYGQQVFDATRRAIAHTLRTHASRRLGASGVVSFAPGNGVSVTAQTLFETPASSGNGAAAASSPSVRVLAQVDATFILATDGRAVILIDQHAAHERIAYEHIVRAAQATPPTEPLLIPALIELDAAQTVVLERTLELLREGGVEIEPFGERMYRLLSTPAGYRARPFDVRGFLDDLTEEPKHRDVRERVWASLACHSVTRAGDRLEVSEMQALIDGLQRCSNPMHCPHGRPTIVRLEPDALARLFKRV